MDLDDEELEATRRMNGANKKMANTDTTYCKSEVCKEKCWRHVSKWRFDKDKDYWFMNICEEERNRIKGIFNLTD